MNIFFLLPFLLVGMPVVYGETLSSFTVYEGVNPDGTTFETLNNPLIFDGNNWVPFIYSNNEIYTSHGNIRANADGSFTWLNKNITDTIVVKYADISNLNSWTYPNTLNNDVPEISWDGSKFVTEKNNAGIGNVKYRYIDYNGVWKTELEATNLSSLTTKVFGFDEYFDIPTDKINFGGQIRNLDNFHGQTFDRTFLVNNQAKVIDLLNGIQYDFDIAFQYLNSVSVIDTGNNSTRLIFDYRMDEVLLPGETIILDPTVTQTSGTDISYIFGATQHSYGEKLETASAQLIGATLESYDVWLKVGGGAPSGDMTGRIYNGAGILQETSTNTINANTLTGSFVQKSFTFAGTHTLAEDDRIVVYFAGGSGANYVAVEHAVADVYDGVNSIRTRFVSSAWNDSATDEMKFIIVYSLGPAPDAVDDLASPTQSYGTVDLVWTQPELNGGTVSGYQINYTTPYGNPLTIITNNTGTSTTSTAVTGLSTGTPYTFGVSVWTEFGNNATKPPMLWYNITTAGNFTIGTAVFNQTNPFVLPITFEEQTINATAEFLNVTFSNTFNLACDFHYKFANINQTYTSLASYPVSSTLSETSFVFTNGTNEIIDVYCWDQNTNTNARYLLKQSDFPILDQILGFRSGDYGTQGMFGVFDLITLLVIIGSMIGLNRENESVGIVFNVMLMFSLSFFGIIELTTVIFGMIALVLVFVITSTKKS